MKNVKKWLSILIGASVIASTILAALPGLAYAKAENPSSDIDNKNRAGLAKMLVARTNIEKKQDALFKRADIWVRNVEDRIAHYKNLGFPWTDLQAALTTFEGQLASSKVYYNETKTLISTHPGFGAAGEVVDITIARQTLKSIVSDQLAARNTLVPAWVAFRTSVHQFSRHNKK